MHWDILDRASQLGTLLGAPGVMGLLASTVQCCPGEGWFADVADFGIAKQYHHPNMHIHVPFCDGTPLTGTLAFASINSHMGAELS